MLRQFTHNITHTAQRASIQPDTGTELVYFPLFDPPEENKTWTFREKIIILRKFKCHFLIRTLLANNKFP